MSEHACELKPHLGGIVQPVSDGLWIHEIDFVSQAVPTITELAANGTMLSRANSHVLGPIILIVGGVGVGWDSWPHGSMSLRKSSSEAKGKPRALRSQRSSPWSFPKTPGPKPRGAAARGLWALKLRASGVFGVQGLGFRGFWVEEFEVEVLGSGC